jgi:hypothetical protein
LLMTSSRSWPMRSTWKHWRRWGRRVSR